MCFFKGELTVLMYFVFNNLKKYTKKTKVVCRPFIVLGLEMKALRRAEKSSVKCTAFYDLIFFKLYSSKLSWQQKWNNRVIVQLLHETK